MKLSGGGSVNLRAPERGETWCADLGVIASEGERPSAAVYLQPNECKRLAHWLLEMTGERSPAAPDVLDALDLPDQLAGVQDAFWDARRKWEALHSAYALVVGDMLGRIT